ncbi:hypothetical protein P171DRAFT_427228 [Karstenula rhodostoma CBS 690.94]|uniref:Ricin B lectin domain-containing protein n=1 Tax=Karstenula rhodostoma CBS 690.94 TaxID=1392251 RepID=A0A9P4PV15_9PLEO|nr:hypothetical protein P171DRAFT_427228 [Karstenula rhodostoma CBS 690.94]
MQSPYRFTPTSHSQSQFAVIHLPFSAFQSSTLFSNVYSSISHSINRTMHSPSRDTTDTATASDDTTVYTPPETEKEGPPAYNQDASSVPQPGKTFLIRERESGQLLTLLDGVVRLHPAGTPGSAFHWSCHERNGWMGFKNVAAGRWLGFDPSNTLQATATAHQGWEDFCVRFMPDGGYVLLMTHWSQLWPVKRKNENGVQKLGKAEAPVKHGLVWEFVAV